MSGLDLLSPVELQAMRLDGDLTRVAGPGERPFAAVDEPCTAAQRAASVASAVPPGGALERLTAAWVHDGLAPPRTIDVAVDRGHRSHREGVGVRYREVVAPLDSRVRIGGVAVTDLARTLADLARCGANASRVRALVRLGRPTPADVERAFAHLGGRHGSRTGRERLAAVLDAAAGVRRR